MAYDFKPLQLHMRIPLGDPRFALGDPDLLFHRVHAFEIRKKKPSLHALAHDHTVSLHIELVLGSDRFRLPEYVHIDLQLIQFLGGAISGKLRAHR